MNTPIAASVMRTATDAAVSTEAGAAHVVVASADRSNPGSTEAGVEPAAAMSAPPSSRF
jgi:hypothetical protein